MFDFGPANIPVNLPMLRMGFDSAAVPNCYFSRLIVTVLIV
jgi:hypothetical protein